MSDLVADRKKKQKPGCLNTKNPVSLLGVNQYLVVKIISLLLLFSLTTGCQEANKPPQQKSQQSNISSRAKTQSLFKNITIEFANEQGETLWKLEVEKAVYSPEGKTAQLEGLTGNLFENGEIVLEVTGKTGTIENNGEKILLEEDIVARDRRNNLIIRSEKAEWRPKEDLLMLQENLNASHPNLEITAKEGIYLTEKEQLELKDKIVGIAKDPPLQMRSEHLLWQIPQEMAIAPQPLEIDRYKNTTITDTLTANRGEVNLKQKTALLEENVALKSLEPPIKITTNSAIWEMSTRIVKSPLPLQIFHRVEEVTVTGKKGEIDLEQQVATISGSVRGESQKEKAEIYAEEVIWEIATQKVEAEGNVIYSQKEPELKFTGAKALGKLQDKQIVVTGNSEEPAVSEIVF